uniref:Uncharacterized protein n=1 Tax=Leersia perrieri TaxID=77586 RepID=A0A0D9WDQ9_9ORYZ
MELAPTPARRPPMEAGMARRLWHVVLAVCHMLRRGLCRKRVMMDLHVLLGRGKLAGRALRSLLAQHHAAVAAASYSSSSSSAMAPFYGRRPREVEFSCTTTPSSFTSYYGGLFPFKRGGRRGGGEYGGLDAAAVARAFEMMSAEVEEGAATPASATSARGSAGWATATPSPMVAWILGRTPAGVRPLRVTDSPFPAVAEDGGEPHHERVDDAEFEDFINKFYEQLRMQPSAATPECQLSRRRRRG